MHTTGHYKRTDCYPRPRKIAPLKFPRNFGQMGCASSQGAAVAASGGIEKPPIEAISLGNIRPDTCQTYPPAEAFEIPLANAVDNNDSLIKKHPPKRLQQLVEQATMVPTATIEDLEEKLARAEVRRQQYIQQKIDSIVTIKKFARDGDDKDGNDNGSHEGDTNTNSFGTRMDGDGSVDGEDNPNYVEREANQNNGETEIGDDGKSADDSRL